MGRDGEREVDIGVIEGEEQKKSKVEWELYIKKGSKS